MDLTVETALGRNLDPLQHEMLCEASTRDIREADFLAPCSWVTDVFREPVLRLSAKPSYPDLFQYLLNRSATMFE